MPAIPLIAAGIGAGGGIAASKIGSNASRDIASQQNRLANRTLAITEPALRDSVNHFRALLEGDPAAFGLAVAPDSRVINQQFDAARRNVLQSAVARGGSLSRSLTNVEAGRAATFADLLTGKRHAAAGILADIGLGGTGQAGQVLSAAASSRASNEAQRAQSLAGFGSFFTRLLTTPGLFGSGGNKVTQITAENSPFPVTPLPAAFIPRPGSGGFGGFN